MRRRRRIVAEASARRREPPPRAMRAAGTAPRRETRGAGTTGATREHAAAGRRVGHGEHESSANLHAARTRWLPLSPMRTVPLRGDEDAVRAVQLARGRGAVGAVAFFAGAGEDVDRAGLAGRCSGSSGIRCRRCRSSPSAPTAMPLGPESVADLAGPSLPVKPFLPVPATWWSVPAFMSMRQTELPSRRAR